jgi:Uma2 family endonuclease
MQSANPLPVTFPLAVIRTQEPKPQRLYSLEAFLQREERGDTLNEYYNGIITKLPMARAPHNRIIMNMATALNNALDKAGKKYFVEGGQQMVYLPKLNVGLYPDVLVVCDTPQYFDTNEVLLMNPLVVVEVLSIGTRKYDRSDKFSKYKTLDSLQEYILIDPNRCAIETRFREEPKLWRDAEFEAMEGGLILRSVDCVLDMKAIYKNITFKK